ncbi:alpha/beta hydrolase [Clostridium sp.]|uniref:alpha/beta hydrolase n=1 Tax=Clostridium sp. TaxID=1506 RepID=UPI003464B5C9
MEILVLISIIIVFTIVLSSFCFYNTFILRSKKKFLINNKDFKSKNINAIWRVDPQWLNNQQVEVINIKGYKDTELRGYYIKAEKNTKNTVILSHGYSGKAMDMTSFGKFYRESLGFNVLMPDARGHGDSEGNYIGFGWHEREDYKRWIDYIIKNNGEDSNIILHGVSMGAATVMMVSGENNIDNVKGIIADCGYTSAKDILSYQMKKMYGLSRFPLIYTTSFLCKLRSGYFFNEASAIEAVKKTNKPILFIHGKEDKFVPLDMVYRLYESCNSNKKLYIVKGANHANSYFADRKGYLNQVKNFLEENI